MEIVAQPQTEAKQSRVPRPVRKVGGFMRRRKKMLILSGMFVLLIVTGYLNWALNSRTPEVGGGGGGGGGGNAGQQHMIASFRQDRETQRASLKVALEFMATAESGFSATAQEAAAQQKLDLITAMQFELLAENAIISLGFADALVTKNGQNINVIIRNPENITDEQATKVLTALEHLAGRDLLDYLHVQIVR